VKPRFILFDRDSNLRAPVDWPGFRGPEQFLPDRSAAGDILLS
jgi:hypothetical protein